MRRLLLASLAFLLLVLPFQAGGRNAARAMDCCPCSGMPACPPACPAPAPVLACAAAVPMALPGEVEAAAPRAEEASPAPRLAVAEGNAEAAARRVVLARAAEEPPDRGDGQALLRVFRI